MATGVCAPQVVWVEGEKVPLMVQKSDGGFGYGTTDMAALRQRVRDERGEWLIYVVDEGQAGHFKRAPPRPRSAWRRRTLAVTWPWLYFAHVMGLLRAHALVKHGSRFWRAAGNSPAEQCSTCSVVLVTSRRPAMVPQKHVASLPCACIPGCEGAGAGWSLARGGRPASCRPRRARRRASTLSASASCSAWTASASARATRARCARGPAPMRACTMRRACGCAMHVRERCVGTAHKQRGALVVTAGGGRCANHEQPLRLAHEPAGWVVRLAEQGLGRSRRLLGVR